LPLEHIAEKVTRTTEMQSYHGNSYCIRHYSWHFCTLVPTGHNVTCVMS